MRPQNRCRLTVSVKATLPAAALAGDREEIDGTGFEPLTVKVAPPEVPPPGAGFTTVTAAVPAVVTSEAGTSAVSFEALTNVVASIVPFQLTADEATKSLPLNVSVKATLPAAALAGDREEIDGTGFDALMVKVAELEVPPPGAGFSTVTAAVPAVVTSEAGTSAVIFEALTNVVASIVPFQFTADEATKSLPLTVSVKAGLPAAAPPGDNDAIEGAGLVASMVKITALEVPPPGPGFATVTLGFAESATSEAGTTAVSCEALTYVVDRAAPSQFTVDDATKSLPSIMRVNIGLPATTLPGVSEEMDGTGFAGGPFFGAPPPPPQPQSRAVARTPNVQLLKD